MANTKQILSIIPVRGFVVFPGMTFHFDVAREKSINAIEHALQCGGYIFLTSQKDVSKEEPSERDIYRIGTIAKIKQMIHLQEGGVRLLVEGLCRGEFYSPLETEGFYEALVARKNSILRTLAEEEYAAFLNKINRLINEFTALNPKISPESVQKAVDESNPSAFADSVASNLFRNLEDKQEILEIANVKKRLMRVTEILASEVKILETETVIAAHVKEQMDDNNRDYYLREQIKAIKYELGEDEFSEVDEFREKIEKLNMPKEVYEKAMRELSSFEKLPPASPESAVSRHYLEVICDYPWNVYTADSDIQKASEILEKDHYGMEKVKKRIIEQLAVTELTGNPGGTVLCLFGAPGVGKTSVARSIAKASGRKYARISLGGVRDEAEIRGHRKTYIGAMPGRIVNSVIQSGSSDPLILLDEIDKLGADYKGDPSSAMLEVLDIEQNNNFRDNFLEIGIDLSKVMFIATANNLDTIPEPLRDRLEIIELSSYTHMEKAEIAARYLIPKQLKKHGLNKRMLKISGDAVSGIITGYTREAGVRELERKIADICRMCAAGIVKGEYKSKSVTALNISEFLGSVRFIDNYPDTEPSIGLVNGLAWTAVGGEVLECEVSVLEGSGKLELTGKLGDVMQESARTALSHIRSISEELGIEKDFYKTKDIHIHFPEGAVPKDGPSAGITVAVAAASALTGRFVRKGIAMTGEITLRGRVLPIGGLKEKSLGAYRMGIREIIIPYDNQKDIEEIPAEVRDKITFHPVKSFEEVLNLSLIPCSEKKTEQLPFMKVSERSAKHEYS